MKTLIISSSLSPSSKSYILCKKLKDTLQQKTVNVELVDARDLDLAPYHCKVTESMENLISKVKESDNIIFGMGVHCYSINDSLKMILDSCCGDAMGKFFGILCAAGGQKSYLSTQHLTQICMNEWRMIQLPRVIYVTSSDFDGNKIKNTDVYERIDQFVDEFIDIGNRLKH